MDSLSLKHSILSALAFGDLFDLPLTPEEIRRNLFFSKQRDVSTYDVLDMLENNSDVRARVESYGGLYFFKGRRDIISIRLDRYAIAQRKYRRAKKIARVLAGVPFVRLICACNTLGWSNARDESDIDFFIIAEHGHLWLVRMLCTGLMQIFGLRPTKQRMKDAICLSFFIADDGLDVSRLFLSESRGMPDIYFFYWLLYCVPLYESDGMYETFWKANEMRVLSVLPCASPYDTNDYRRIQISYSRRAIKKFFERCIGFLGDVPNRMARWIQLRVLPQDLRAILNTDTCVVMNDSVLKFHQEDRREEIRERFMRRLEEFGVEVSD
ncbi:hypothetical protein HYW94_03770 [Candidatus Uhrbacteria bacterium]|nr:hypothetical protein [Candidatus Uhrbacteria bacterium]